MAQPTPYSLATDFSAEEANNQTGRSTVRTTALDAELAAIEVTLDQLCTNIGLIQRDDGQIRDGMVKIHTLGDDVRVLFSLYGATVRGAWLTATSYVKADVVTEAGVTYICAVNHVSGTFATDLAAVKWIALNSGNATNMGFTPAAGIAATTVQAALEEIGNQVGDGTAAISFRNRIINGDMRIDQRSNGSALTVNSGTRTYGVDRWCGTASPSGVFTITRSNTTPPAGFVNHARITVTTADASLGATDYYAFRQGIEGANVADLAWGSADAKTVTLSFRVRSSVTGTFGGCLNNSGSTRSYPFTYAINQANTWESKTVTIPGDTSGTWLTDNGLGVDVLFGLGVGSTYSGTPGAWAGANYVSATGGTNLMATLSATLDITGVQFELGTVATPFELRPYGLELALCQRYCVALASIMTISGNQWGVKYNTQFMESNLVLPVPMRANPLLEGTAITTWVTSAPSGTQASAFGGSAGAYLAITGALTIGVAATNIQKVLLRYTAGTSFGGTNGESVVMFLGSGQNYRFVADF
jgi:hypothetical protein